MNEYNKSKREREMNKTLLLVLLGFIWLKESFALYPFYSAQKRLGKRGLTTQECAGHRVKTHHKNARQVEEW